MNTRKTMQKTISFLIWSTFLVFAVVLPKVFQFEAWSIAVGILPSALRLAYEHFDNFNLAVNRFFLWVFNKEVAWEVKADLVGNVSPRQLQSVTSSILKQDQSARILHDGDDEKTISISDIGLTIKVSITSVRSDEDAHQRQIRIVVPRVFTPFRHNTVLLNSLTKILASARELISIEKEFYTFSAIFLDENPYLGLFLRTMKLPDTANLNVEYNESEGVTEGRVAVKKNKIVVMTQNVNSLQALSKKYITLSSLNLSAA